LIKKIFTAYASALLAIGEAALRQFGADGNRARTRLYENENEIQHHAFRFNRALDIFLRTACMESWMRTGVMIDNINLRVSSHPDARSISSLRSI